MMTCERVGSTIERARLHCIKCITGFLNSFLGAHPIFHILPQSLLPAHLKQAIRVFSMFEMNLMFISMYVSLKTK